MPTCKKHSKCPNHCLKYITGNYTNSFQGLLCDHSFKWSPSSQKSFQCYQKWSIIAVFVQFVYALCELHEGNTISQVINIEILPYLHIMLYSGWHHWYLQGQYFWLWFLLSNEEVKGLIHHTSYNMIMKCELKLYFFWLILQIFYSCGCTMTVYTTPCVSFL